MKTTASDLAELLREVMETRQFTSQREFAEVAGVSQATISKILSGHAVKVQTLETIAANLGISVEALYRHAGLLPPERGRNTRDRTPTELEPLIANIRMLRGTPHYEPVMRLLYQIVDYALFALDAPEE